MEIHLNSTGLLNWFDRYKINYPWGEDKSAYLVWISEVMLQQTVAATVVPYFETWRKEYPDTRSLAGAGLEEVLSRWEGLGYYSRCRNIHKAAIYLMEHFDGELPDNYKELVKVPGIGDYTARALLSIAFNQAYPVLDANVRRILQRLSAVREWDSGKDSLALAFLEETMPADRPGDFNEAMMQLGQQICTTGSPHCSKCPLKENCLAFEKDLTSEIPPKKARRIKVIEKTVLIIHWKGKILMGKKNKGLFHDLWMLPSVDDDSGRWEEMVGGDQPLIKRKMLTKRNHFYTDNKDILSPCLITSDDIDLREMTPADDDNYTHKWIDISDLERYPCPSVYRKILDEMKDLL